VSPENIPPGLPESGRSLPQKSGLSGCGLTFSLALLSTVLLAVAEDDGQRNFVAAGLPLLIQVTLVLMGLWWSQRRVRSGRTMPDFILPGLIGLGVLPLVQEAWAWFNADRTRPFEMMMLASLRNLVLGMAAISPWRRYQRLGAGLSVFLAIFATSLGHDRLLVILLCVYAVLGIWWLMGSYWETVREHMAAQVQHDLPRRWLIALPVLVLACVLLLGLNTRAATTALRGFMPTSGGTDWYDETARGGVNDGDALVSATDSAMSFGPVESDLFLDSRESSLYDAFNDTLGETVPPNNERSVPLPASLLKETSDQIAKAKKAGREFSTVRQPVRKRQEQQDVESPAVLYVAGRVPLHLRLTEYDLFDGHSWYPVPEPEHARPLAMMTIHDRPWLRLTHDERQEDIFIEEVDAHVVKIATLSDHRIPLPLYATTLHIDRVDRADLFAWDQDHVLRIQRKSVPAMTVIHQTSLVADPEKLRELPPGRFLHSGPRPAFRAVPTDETGRLIEHLAEEWTAGHARGWEQIEAIVRKLRSDYSHDRSAIVDLKTESSLLEFLTATKRGPDYLFASSTALMLRSLRYPTRLVSGFYARPDRYDPRRRNTAVLPEDVHFWCEVYMGSGTWIAIEPTPGYELLAPPPGWLERARLACVAAAGWCLDRIIPLTALLTLLTALWWQRTRLLDAFRTWLWNHPQRSSRQLVLATHRLLLSRMQAAGFAREPGESAARLYECVWQQLLQSEAASGLELNRMALSRWLRLLDWARYAPPDMEPSRADFLTGPVAGLEQQLVERTAREIGRAWTLTRLRQASADQMPQASGGCQPPDLWRVTAARPVASVSLHESGG